MRLTILIFLLSCSQIPTVCENFGEKVPEKEVYGFFGPSALFEEPTDKRSNYTLERGERFSVMAQSDYPVPKKNYKQRYLCVKNESKAGWIFKDYTCVPPNKRTSREEPKIWPDKNFHWCPSKRTLPSDKDFFSGTFHTNMDKLITTYHKGYVVYELDLKDLACSFLEQGRLKIRGNTAYNKYLTLTFTDDYVDLKSSANSSCPNFEKEFYFLLKGPKINHRTHSQSACNPSVSGITREKLLSNFYALKKSVKNNDAVSLSSLLRYPIFVTSNLKTVEIKGPHHFQKMYKRLNIGCLKEGIAKTRLSDLFCNYRGVMLGSGQIWMMDKIYALSFDGWCEKEPKYWN